MKKLVVFSLVGIICCVGSPNLMAAFPVNVGVHGGMNTTKMNVSTSGVNVSMKAGYMVGAFARLNAGPIYVEPSLNYAHRTSEIGGDKVQYSSFDVPVMVGYYLLDVPLFKLRACIGPVASFPGDLKTTILGKEAKMDMKTTLWSGKLGVGVDVWKATFDFEYEQGLTKLNKDFGVKAPSIFNITLGFKFI
ncbi:hypothetical protein FACS1894195_5070 [Bacteroidia bacterium]|nr:hypothetical protein FACS1894195_5070 [Bacteroidia bacterium]